MNDGKEVQQIKNPSKQKKFYDKKNGKMNNIIHESIIYRLNQLKNEYFK